VDILGRELGWVLDDDERNVTKGCAAVVNSERVAFIQESGEADFWPLDKKLPDCVDYFQCLNTAKANDYDIFLIATDREFAHTHPDYYAKAVIYRPKSLILGMGCDKDTPFKVIENGVLHHLAKNNFSLKSVKAVASIDLKNQESGLLELCRKYDWEFITYPAEILDNVEGIENPSEIVKKYTGSRTVAEGACLLLAGTDKLLLPKQSYKEENDIHNMTLAIARIPFKEREIDIKNK
jgi:cobalt-precorrin 5A hydrolase